MPTHTFSATVPAAPTEVYAFLADFTNLPRYLPLMTAARLGPDGQIEIDTEVKGAVHTMRAWFRRDDATRHIEWGAVENARYHGWITVTDAGTTGGGATVDYGIESPRPHTLEPYFRAATTFVTNALAPQANAE